MMAFRNLGNELPVTVLPALFVTEFLQGQACIKLAQGPGTINSCCFSELWLNKKELRNQ